MRFRIFTVILTFQLALFSFSSFSQTIPAILTERQRAEAVDAILEDRFENLLPQLMRREGVDMWVIISFFLAFPNLLTETGPPKPIR